MQALLARIPHVTIPQLARRLGDPFYSPDGRFYALEYGRVMEIHAANGTLRAMARKRGWGPVILGWAPDSSGVYFYLQTGGDAAVLNPEMPIFKLSMPSN